MSSSRKIKNTREHFRANSFIVIYELKTGLRIAVIYKRPKFFYFCTGTGRANADRSN